MITKSKAVTVAGLVIAIGAILVDPANAPWLTALLGANAAAKVGAVGAMLAALGKALFAESPPPAP